MRADQAGESFFPHQFMYKILLSGDLKDSYQIDPKDSWLLAAAERNLPMFVPGWEDSTLGNMYAGHCISGDVKRVHTVRTGIEYMMELAEWYTATTAEVPLGFFQIAGGIAGDFPICVVPMLHQDLQREHVPLWAYFCQISDSTTSYGSSPAPFPTRRSPGASWASTLRSSSSSRTQPSSRRWSLLTYSAGNLRTGSCRPR